MGVLVMSICRRTYRTLLIHFEILITFLINVLIKHVLMFNTFILF